MLNDDYPASVVEVLDDRIRFKPETLRAVQVFAASGPWTGTLDERKQKFAQMNGALAASEAIPAPRLAFRTIDGSSSGASYYLRSSHQIVLVGKLSVVTYLHEFAHAVGCDEREACRWSINLFKRCFPGQYAKLVHVGHCLIDPCDLRQGQP